jgi:putative membrane protein
LITGLAILGFGWNALQQSHVDAGRLGPVQSASRHLSDTPLWLLVVQLLVGALVVISLLSVAGYLLSYYGFRLTRHTGGTLQVTRGLLTSRATSIEQTRLRGVELSEPLLLRAAGGARLIAVATGLRVGRGAERGGTVLVPPAPRSIVYEVGQRVLDEDGAWSAVADPLRRHGAAALRRRVVRACLPWLLITAALVLLTTTAGLPAWIPLSALALTLAFGWIGLDRYRSLGHLVVGSYLATGAGSLARRRVALEAEGIIGWNIRRTMFQRRLGLATLTATTAAGRQGYPVIDISSVDAVDVIRRATPGLLEEFIRQRQQDR